MRLLFSAVVWMLAFYACRQIESKDWAMVTFAVVLSLLDDME